MNQRLNLFPFERTVFLLHTSEKENACSIAEITLSLNLVMFDLFVFVCFSIFNISHDDKTN